jgi:peptide/nickel transport system permease protein
MPREEGLDTDVSTAADRIPETGHNVSSEQAAHSERRHSARIGNQHTVSRSHVPWYRRLLSHRLAVIGGGILVILSLTAVFAEQLSAYEPVEIDLRHMLEPPSADHWLGTDDLGRDILSRLLHAGRISLSVGVATSVVAVISGTLLGAFAGYYKGLVDLVISRVIDTLLSFPILALALVVAGFTKITPTSLVLIIASMSWMSVARLVRAEVLSLCERDFILAAEASGATNTRIILRHLIPNALAPVMVSATLLVAHAILIESALSFLGFGIQPPDPTWGNMLHNAQRYIREAPWMAVYPGLLIALTVMSTNLLGDGLREAVDPRLRL